LESWPAADSNDVLPSEEIKWPGSRIASQTVPAEGKLADVKLTGAEAEPTLTQIVRRVPASLAGIWVVAEATVSPCRATAHSLDLSHGRIGCCVTDQKQEVPTDNLLVATVIIKTGSQSERIPCVVDRENHDIRLFAADKWVTSADWVKSAPMP
jgi:hypothetical protein